jgi:AcrR family transcriptional regulator
MGTRGVAGLSVRGVIETSGLAPRYFYEGFADLEALQVAVFEQVVAEVEAEALAALADAGRGARSRIHAAIAATIELLLDDPRKGRVALVESLSSPALGQLRARAVSRFATLLAANSRAAWRDLDARDHAVVITAQFAIGGFGETLTGVLLGRITADRDQLADDLTELFLGTGVAIRAMIRRQ